MDITKQRNINHIIGDEASRFVQTILPTEWICRTVTPDYGIDFDIEIVDYKKQKYLTLGEHILLQVKGTKNPKYGFLNNDKSNIKIIKFNLEVTELNLVESMGCAIPILLIIVDLKNKKAYQICLNDYIKKVLFKENPNYKRNKTITIHIPIENEVNTSKIDSFKWYAKRIKIYSMFNEMLIDIEDFNHMTGDELIDSVNHFIQYYKNYNIFEYKSCWYALEDIYNTFIQLENNNLIDENIKNHYKKTLNLNESKMLNSIIKGKIINKSGTNIFSSLQQTSIELLKNQIINYSGYFETYCREWYMPGCLLGVTPH